MVKNSLILIIALVLFSPYIFYEIGLFNIKGRPTYAINRVVNDKEAQKIWNDLGETGTIEIPKLNPWIYIFSFFQKQKAKNLLKKNYIVGAIARNYNEQHLKDRRTIYWHLSGSALIIWLSQNWSTQDILAKAKEIQNNEATRNPCAKLLPTPEDKRLCFLSFKQRDKSLVR